MSPVSRSKSYNKMSGETPDLGYVTRNLTPDIGAKKPQQLRKISGLVTMSDIVRFNHLTTKAPYWRFKTHLMYNRYPMFRFSILIIQ